MCSDMLSNIQCLASQEASQNVQTGGILLPAVFIGVGVFLIGLLIGVLFENRFYHY